MAQSLNDGLAMIVWTEDMLRAASSWKAFKEGKMLVAAVSEVKVVDGTVRGAVRGGKRPYRVSVVVRSAHDIDARCSCAENQATGVICGHAVALALAALEAPAKPVAEHALPEPPRAISFPAREVRLPTNWRESMIRGKLSFSLAVVKGEAAGGEDQRLGAWLKSELPEGGELLQLHLVGAQLAAFLEILVGHPRVRVGKEARAIAIADGKRLRLRDSMPVDDAWVLVADEELGEWVNLAGGFWWLTEDSISRAGQGALPRGLVSAWGRWLEGKPVEMPLVQVLGSLEAWLDWLWFPDHGWLDSLHFVPAPVRVCLNLEGSLQHLQAKMRIDYAEEDWVCPGLGSLKHLPKSQGQRCDVRNWAAEQAAVTELESMGFQVQDRGEGTWVLRGEDAILDFMGKHLQGLRNDWLVADGPRFLQVAQQVVLVAPTIEILGSGEDWLSFDLKFKTTAGNVIPVEEVRRLLRSSGKSAGLTGTKRVLLSGETARLIEPLFSDLELEQKDGHYEASARAGEVIREIHKKIHKAYDLNKLNDFSHLELPSTFQAALRPYQLRGAGWMMDRVNRFGGALLADDMGLGKTIQAIALIERLFCDSNEQGGVVLVVVTTSLLGNWRSEFERFAPARRVIILHGAKRDQERERVVDGDVVLTSYGTLARDLAWHLRHEYRAVVVDEASLMRNPDTDHAKAVSKLKARARVALTGTPVENSVRDLWSIFRFIQPGWLGGRRDFAERYGAEVSGQVDRSSLERLRLKISPFVLRRTKEQVAPELPSKIIIDEFCELSKEQQGVYRDLWTEGRKRVEAIADSGQSGAARMQVLTALLRLRQTCCDLALLGNERFEKWEPVKRSAKMQRLLELLEEALNGEHKVLIFSQFQKQLVEIEKAISGCGWDSLRLDGKTRDRQALVDQFQSADGPPIFLISLKAGGYGLNLTAADIVIHFDPWWNPAAEAQATDRAHRIGQVRPVTVYRLLARGTVEEKVLRLQESKKQLSAVMDESGQGDAAGWTMEELQSLMS